MAAFALPLVLPELMRPKKAPARRTATTPVVPSGSFGMPVVERQPNGIKVVLFAGGGGSCTGIEAALARLGDPSPYVDAAVNHDVEAVALHRANHPRTRHYCNNVWRVRPLQIITDFGGRPIDFLWASPDCTDFSKAKGGTPLRKHIRDLAWIVLAYAKLPAHLRPLMISLENVEEWWAWGPLRQRRWPDDHNDKKLRGKLMFDLYGKPVMEPDPAQRGRTRAKWVREHKKLGYSVDFREIRASVKGTPTIRKRLYVVLRCDRKPIVWLPNTHGVGPGLQPMRTAAECLDFSLPCPSIFMTKAEAKAFTKRTGIKVKRPLVYNTLRRVARGIDRFVLRDNAPFLIPITHQGDARVHSIHEGLRTTTTAPRGEEALVQHALAPSIVRTAHGEQDRKGRKRGKGEHSVREPLPTQPASNDFAIAAPVLVNYKGASIGSSMKDGAPTITANSFIKRPGGSPPLAMAAPVLAGCGGRASQSPPKRVDKPKNTSTTKADEIVVAPTLIQTGYGERLGQEPRSLDMQKPLGTAVAGGVKHADVEAVFLAKQYGGHESPGWPIPKPISSLTTQDHHHAVAVALSHQYTSNTRGGEGSPRKPIKTIMAGGQHAAVIQAFVVKYHRDGGQFADLRDPMHTADCEDRMAVIEVETIPAPYLTEEQRRGALRCVRFLQDFGVLPKNSDVQMVLVKGMPMVDIGMRMLIPRELFNAQGFPPSYIIDRGLFVDPVTGAQEWRPLTKTAQVRMVGNSVCPPVAEDIIFANYPANDDWIKPERAVA